MTETTSRIPSRSPTGCSRRRVLYVHSHVTLLSWE
jgi:hypothetical protein